MKLGFGLMRLPRLEDGAIDVTQVAEMVDLFAEAGGTYYDTAYVYEGSEEAIREALVSRCPRESYTLATKVNAWLHCLCACLPAAPAIPELMAEAVRELEEPGT